MQHWKLYYYFPPFVHNTMKQLHISNQWFEIHAGSVFLGQWTPESVGDYASGTNHVLPTYGYARMYGGVSLDSFLKYITVQSLTEEGLRKLGPYVATMAEIEGLEAHKRAVTLRLEDIEAGQVAGTRWELFSLLPFSCFSFWKLFLIQLKLSAIRKSLIAG